MRHYISKAKKLARIASRPVTSKQFWRDVGRIRRMLADSEISKTHFPSELRKSQTQMFLDNLFWLLVRQEINEYYFCWGLDRTHGPNIRDLFAYRDFRNMRDHCNQNVRNMWGYNYIVILRDKLLFAHCMKAMGHPTPPVVAIVDKDEIEWCANRQRLPLDSICEIDSALDGFVKPLHGEQGQGIFSLQIIDGNITVDGVALTLEELRSHFKGKSILQNRVVQHPVLSDMYPRSLNTIRITTVRENGRARQFSYPYFRVGSGSSVVDNFKAGGMQVFVDIDTGRLSGPARRLRGGIMAHHPDSGIAFDGFEIPHFPEAVDLVVRVHNDLIGLHSVGWDVAITPNGPTLIEGNDNWNGSIRMGLDPNFKREFTRLCALR